MLSMRVYVYVSQFRRRPRLPRLEKTLRYEVELISWTEPRADCKYELDAEGCLAEAAYFERPGGTTRTCCVCRPAVAAVRAQRHPPARAQPVAGVGGRRT